MDCTYKTNRYGLPLLNIVGVTATGNSFNIAFAFLQNEKQSCYVWALNAFKSCVNHEPAVVVTDRELALMAALSEVFPRVKHLLCVWHINKNILAKCRKHFVGIGGDEDKAWDSFMSSWSECTEATTVDDYEASWLRFMHRYRRVSPQSLAYIDTTWIVYKERFVKAFVNRYLHLGCRSTSRVEGNHSVLKNSIVSSTKNLLSVCSSIDTVLKQQFDLYKIKTESDKINTPLHVKRTPFLNVIGKISQYVLNLMHNHLTAAHDPVCTGSFTATYGLPCAHTLKSLIEREMDFDLALVHKQWHLPANDIPVPPTEPSGIMERITG